MSYHVHYTHSFVLLEVSQKALKEIWRKLSKTGYTDQLHVNAEGMLIDMHGIALVPEKPKKRRRGRHQCNAD